MRGYDCQACDLCGSSESEILIESDSPLGMTSDSRIVRRPLRKIICAGCGLVREGRSFSRDELAAHYRDAYLLNTADQEHVFFREGRAVPRSSAIADWMLEILEVGQAKGRVRTAFEVGAGRGRLMAALARRMPEVSFSGCEVSASAAVAAAAKGIRLVRGDVSAVTGCYDLLLAFGVLEHVSSPRRFLSALGQHLTPGGVVVVGQPTQDMPGYDIFFVDHLHHFRTEHVVQFAGAAGLVQKAVLSAPWFAPSFSLHLLQGGSPRPEPLRFLPADAARSAVKYWGEVFRASERLDRSRPTAVYGLGEIAALLYCYGGLSALNVVVALDDRPQRYTSNLFNVPAKRLEDLTEAEKKAIDAVVLCLPPRYHLAVSERCREQGLRTVSLLGPS